MKALGWALILVGGGLVVLGGRKLLASRNEVTEEEELAIYPNDGEWEQHLLDVEQQERNAHTSVRDLNDGV